MTTQELNALIENLNSSSKSDELSGKLETILKELVVTNSTDYTVYAANVSQTGLNNPTVNKLEDTTGTTVSVTRSTTGTYFFTFGEAFPDRDKVQVFVGEKIADGTGVHTSHQVGSSIVTITTSDVDTPLVPADELLDNTPIRILIYSA